MTTTSSTTQGLQLVTNGNDEQDTSTESVLSAPPMRRTHTLDDVRSRVATGVAVRAINSSSVIDGVRVGVALTLSKASEDDLDYLNHVVSRLRHNLLLQEYLFLIAPAGPHTIAWPLVIIGSTSVLVSKAGTLACAKFLGRFKEITFSDADPSRSQWLGYIDAAGSAKHDEMLLWDIARKSSRLLDPLTPPKGSRSIDTILAQARTRLERITPQQAYAELHDPNFPASIVLVDIRPFQQRADFGTIPEALVIERNVLEWRFDPRSESRISVADRYDLRVIIFCQEGYTSSLAAASLHDLGLLSATDVIGGFKAWREAGLPVDDHTSASDSSRL